MSKDGFGSLFVLNLLELLLSLLMASYADQIGRELPPEIDQMTELESLTLEQGLLTTLPPEIGNLTELRTLSLSNNDLMTLPPEI